MLSLRAITLFTCTLVGGLFAQAQSFGVLLGGSYRDLYAGGKVFGPAFGAHAGFFVPFHTSDRLVLRAEAGATVLRGKAVEDDATSTRSTQLSVTGAILGRYYVCRTVCFTAGAGYVRSLSTPDPILVGTSAKLPERNDVNIFFGAAYRFSKRVECGVRYGIGLQPMMDAGPWGVAKHRYASLITSYLLHQASTKMAKRRGWRSDLGSAPRY